MTDRKRQIAVRFDRAAANMTPRGPGAGDDRRGARGLHPAGSIYRRFRGFSKVGCGTGNLTAAVQGPCKGSPYKGSWTLHAISRDRYRPAA